MSASAASWRAKAGSLASSSAWKRRFSSSRTSSGFIAATAPRPLPLRPHALVRLAHGAVQQFTEARRHRIEAQALHPLPPGPAEVGAEDDAGAAIDQVGDR